MRVLLIGAVAAMMLVAIGAVDSNVEAAMMQGVRTLPPQTKGYNGIEEVGYYRRYARRAYRRGYYGYGYPYYGYRPYGYYGYGYRPYGYYGYGWRPGISIYVGPGWGWGY
jgi:hypothetical protein